MKLDEQEVLRYMGTQEASFDNQSLINEAYQRIVEVMRPRNTYRVYSCRVDANQVIVENNIRWTSEQLAKHLQTSAKIIVFAATLGLEVDLLMRRLALKSVALGAAAQAVAASLIEGYCNELQERWKTQYAEYKLTWRYSPGYGDWGLEEQKSIFALLECSKTIGVTLTAGSMMSPTKSVTAVIGLSTEDVPQMISGCSGCDNISCTLRKVE